MGAELNSPICQDMVGKIGKGLAHLLDRDGPYDLVILMAGTNDFVPNVIFKTISDSVCRLHSECHKRGVPTVMLAAPCNLAEMRIGVGRLLQDWARKNPTKVLGFLDPEDVMPRSKVACWEPDHLHFSPTGSRTLGAHLSTMVAQILQKLGQTTHGRSSQIPASSMVPRPTNLVASKQMLHMSGSLAASMVVGKAITPRRLSAWGGA